MVSTLARNVRDAGLNATLGTIFPIFTTPTALVTYNKSSAIISIHFVNDSLFMTSGAINGLIPTALTVTITIVMPHWATKALFIVFGVLRRNNFSGNISVGTN